MFLAVVSLVMATAAIEKTEGRGVEASNVPEVMPTSNLIKDLPAHSPSKKYLFGQVLGEGGQGVVMLAKHVVSNEVYAVKIAERENTRATVAEVKILQTLDNHKNVVNIKDFEHDEKTGRTFVFTEVCGGGELFNKIAQSPRGRLPDFVAKYYFAALCRGLAHMHSQGVAHRDVKPENLLLSRDGDLKISDFGLSTIVERRAAHASAMKQEDGSQVLSKTALGSIYYAAPEIYHGPYDAFKADVWSAAVVLFCMLGGRPPFQAATNSCKFFRALAQDNLRWPSFFDKYAVDVLKACLVVDPKKRPDFADILKMKWLQDRRAKIIPVRALNLLRSLLSANEEEWASMDELYKVGWLSPEGRKSAEDSNGTTVMKRRRTDDSLNVQVPSKEDAPAAKRVRGSDHHRIEENDGYSSVSTMTPQTSAELMQEEDQSLVGAKQVESFGWTGVDIKRSRIYRRVLEKFAEMGLIVTSKSDIDHAGRSEVVAWVPDAIAKGLAKKKGMDSQAPVHTLSHDVPGFFIKLTIFEEKRDGNGGPENHTIHFTRGTGDVFVMHRLYAMIRSHLTELNGGCL